MTWNPKPCGCINAILDHHGKVAIRCPKHRGKPGRTKKGRLRCYFNEDGHVRAE